MTIVVESSTARVPLAPGRSCVERSRLGRVLRSVASGVAILVASSCQLVGVAETPAPAPEPEPGIAEGFTTPEERAAGADLLVRAEAAWAAGQVEEAARLARSVVDDYPRVDGSSRALRILAEAALQLGEHGEAVEAADRYAALYPPSSEGRAQGVLLGAEARGASNDARGAVLTLLEMSEETPAGFLDRGRERMGEFSRTLGVEVLEELATGPAALQSPVATPLLAEWATVLHFRGEEEEARRVAGVIVERAPAGSPADSVAVAIVEGRADEVLGVAPVVGAIFSLESSPSIRPFAEAVAEGIRLAIEGQSEGRRPVQLQSLDDGATASRAGTALLALQNQGVLAVLGPLMDDGLAAGLGSRTEDIPVVSPTARTIPEGARNVYSLAAPDPTGGRTLARWALENGIRRAALVYPRDPDATVEAAAFAEAFRAGGGTVVLDRSFAPGTSFFRDVMREVAAASPEVLVLPLSQEEVEVVAPQVTFYGLDTQGIRVLGTGGWTSEETLRDVDVRHTEGVVAVTSRPPGAVQERYLEFVRAYESFYQKTLRTPVAALGYDAARMVLRALESGARTPEEVARALEGIRGFPGATGDISVEGGRIVRRSVPVRLENRSLVVLNPGG